MKILFFVLLFTYLGFIAWAFHTESLKTAKQIACVRGFRFAAAHYKVFDKVSVEQIKYDSLHGLCVDWVLE